MSLEAFNTVTGEAFNDILGCGDITPGSAPGYHACKQIMAYHPLGAKMTDAPVALAQSQQRKITVQKGPEERLVEAFEAEWAAMEADKHIFNVARLSRGYGLASIALLTEGTPSDRPVNFRDLYRQRIGINVFDPLNTAGSLTLNQDPNSLDFQKVTGIAVAGQPYHRSRAVVLMNENPLYIEWTSSAFGFVGRSVFQRALYPLKSFIRSMVTDDLILLKAGVLVAKMKPPGSIVDRVMQSMAGQKRALIKQAVVGNVLGIGPDEAIETLNFTNLEGPASMARKNVLDNIATSADMPAALLNQETFAEGFGEGTEDAKRVSQYINRIRVWLWPVYHWMDKVVMHRAWNPEFYETIQKDFPDQYARMGYTQAFYAWTNSFKPIWPNLIEEPDSERIKVDDVRLKAAIAAVQVLMPVLDPENTAIALMWLQDCFNERKELFPSHLELDFDALRAQLEERAAMAPMAQGPEEPEPPAPFSQRDSIGDSAERTRAALEDLTAAVSALPALRERHHRRAVAG